MAAQLRLIYPSASFDAQNAKAYFHALRDIDGGYISAALGDIVRLQDRFPSVAEIRRCAVGYRDRDRPRELRPGGMLTRREWFDIGCPGIDEHDYTPAEAERIWALPAVREL
jgi:hypothetical protein